MKTDRVQNGDFEKAKETVGDGYRLGIAGPRKIGRRTAVPCNTLERATERKRPKAVGAVTPRVTATIDVGYGNALFIRGEGQGLSWDKGLPLTCVDGSTWVWSSHRRPDQVIFKLLINDQLWCRGENITAAAGRKVEVVPVF